jgi:aspartate aminotransferase
MSAGAFYVYVDCSGTIGQTAKDGIRINSSGDLAKYFLECAGIAIVPGEAFESGASFRLSIASSMKVLEGACTAMAAACKELL